jgi:hypothetical protein
VTCGVRSGGRDGNNSAFLEAGFIMGLCGTSAEVSECGHKTCFTIKTSLYTSTFVTT